MSINNSDASLDAEKIRKLVGGLSNEERELFTSVIRDVKDRGTAISDAVINSLAKKLADKARQLSGNG